MEICGEYPEVPSPVLGAVGTQPLMSRSLGRDQGSEMRPEGASAKGVATELGKGEISPGQNSRGRLHGGVGCIELEEWVRFTVESALGGGVGCSRGWAQIPPTLTQSHLWYRGVWSRHLCPHPGSRLLRVFGKIMSRASQCSRGQGRKGGASCPGSISLYSHPGLERSRLCSL